MNPAQAMNALYSLALFGPGVGGATFGYVLLRAERLLAGDTFNGVDAERLEAAQHLRALRHELEARQTRLQLIHDALLPRSTHRQARGSRIEREAKGEDPGR